MTNRAEARTGRAGETEYAAASRPQGELRRQLGLALRRLCQADGEFQPTLLDRHQLICRELALAAAELAVADAVLDQAG